VRSWPTGTVAPRHSRDRTEAALASLAARYGLEPDAQHRLGLLLGLLVDDPAAPTAIRTPEAALEDHLADALVGLECSAVRVAQRALDLGSGPGLPGLPLAIALPSTAFTLLEGSSRKVAFLERAVELCGLANVEVAHSRAESYTAGRDRYDLVTARAVAPLPVVLEYAAPLLQIDGTLVVWRGRHEPDLEASARRAAGELGLGTPTITPVRPYPRAEHRHLYSIVKIDETPTRFPRRPGMALKRPLGIRAPRTGPPSDRVQR